MVTIMNKFSKTTKESFVSIATTGAKLQHFILGKPSEKIIAKNQPTNYSDNS